MRKRPVTARARAVDVPAGTIVIALTGLAALLLIVALVIVPR